MRNHENLLKWQEKNRRKQGIPKRERVLSIPTYSINNVPLVYHHQKYMELNGYDLVFPITQSEHVYYEKNKGFIIPRDIQKKAQRRIKYRKQTEQEKLKRRNLYSLN